MQTQIKVRPCYYCEQHMVGVAIRDITDERTGQHYIRSIHVCPHCDYWQINKIPSPLAATIEPGYFHEAIHSEDSEEDQAPAVTNVLDQEAQAPLKGIVAPRFYCLFCERLMSPVFRGEVSNERTGQTYVKTRYKCAQCDYWHITKTPRVLATS
jgi:hypothetical protein